MDVRLDVLLALPSAGCAMDASSSSLLLSACSHMPTCVTTLLWPAMSLRDLKDTDEEEAMSARRWEREEWKPSAQESRVEEGGIWRRMSRSVTPAARARRRRAAGSKEDEEEEEADEEENVAPSSAALLVVGRAIANGDVREEEEPLLLPASVPVPAVAAVDAASASPSAVRMGGRSSSPPLRALMPCMEDRPLDRGEEGDEGPAASRGEAVARLPRGSGGTDSAGLALDAPPSACAAEGVAPGRGGLDAEGGARGDM